jgi:choline transport protein
MLGWLTMIGWQAIVASGCYLGAQLIQGMIAIGNPTYQPTAWQLLLIYWAILVVSLSVNTLIAHQLPNVENIILVIHTLGFFAVLIPLVYFAPHGDAKYVFTSFTNGGEWPSNGISFLIGCVGPVFSLLGES